MIVSSDSVRASVRGRARRTFLVHDPCNASAMTWREHLLESEEAISALLARTQRVAVLGIKKEAQSGQPAYYVPEYLAEAGLEVIPVPVYYPEATTILGRPVYRRLADVPGEIDLVDVFRRGPDVAQHVDDMLAAKPRAVWMQSGIRNDV